MAWGLDQLNMLTKQKAGALAEAFCLFSTYLSWLQGQSFQTLFTKCYSERFGYIWCRAFSGPQRWTNMSANLCSLALCPDPQQRHLKQVSSSERLEEQICFKSMRNFEREQRFLEETGFEIELERRRSSWLSVVGRGSACRGPCWALGKVQGNSGYREGKETSWCEASGVGGMKEVWVWRLSEGPQHVERVGEEWRLQQNRALESRASSPSGASKQHMKSKHLCLSAQGLHFAVAKQRLQ